MFSGFFLAVFYLQEVIHVDGLMHIRHAHCPAQWQTTFRLRVERINSTSSLQSLRCVSGGVEKFVNPSKAISNSRGS